MATFNNGPCSCCGCSCKNAENGGCNDGRISISVTPIHTPDYIFGSPDDCCRFECSVSVSLPGDVFWFWDVGFIGYEGGGMNDSTVKIQMPSYWTCAQVRVIAYYTTSEDCPHGSVTCMASNVVCVTCCNCGTCPKVEFEGADSPCKYCIAPNIYCADSVTVSVSGTENCSGSLTLLRQSGPICCDCVYHGRSPEFAYPPPPRPYTVIEGHAEIGTCNGFASFSITHFPELPFDPVSFGTSIYKEGQFCCSFGGEGTICDGEIPTITVTCGDESPPSPHPSPSPESPPSPEVSPDVPSPEPSPSPEVPTSPSPEPGCAGILECEGSYVMTAQVSGFADCTTTDGYEDPVYWSVLNSVYGMDQTDTVCGASPATGEIAMTTMLGEYDNHDDNGPLWKTKAISHSHYETFIPQVWVVLTCGTLDSGFGEPEDRVYISAFVFAWQTWRHFDGSSDPPVVVASGCETFTAPDFPPFGATPEDCHAGFMFTVIGYDRCGESSIFTVQTGGLSGEGEA